MNYYVINHQHKGMPYHKALRLAGHKPIARQADVTLVDRDWFMHNDKQPRRQVIDQLKRGSLIMIYPHSALPPWWYDGLIKIQPYVSCVFVIGEGAKKAIQIIEPNVRVEITGWPWSIQKPFAPANKVKQVLFAPVHPAGGKLRPEALEMNRAIFKELKHVQRAMGLKVMVRYIDDLEKQGLRPYSAFEWIRGEPDGSTTEIDLADVVIAEGTMMYLAVSRGKSTIGINQHVPIRANKNCELYTPHHWDQYGPEIAYPINYVPGNLAELINQAISGEQTEWRNRMIGKSMDPIEFAAKVEKIWKEEKHK